MNVCKVTFFIRHLFASREHFFSLSHSLSANRLLLETANSGSLQSAFLDTILPHQQRPQHQQRQQQRQQHQQRQQQRRQQRQQQQLSIFCYPSIHDSKAQIVINGQQKNTIFY